MHELGIVTYVADAVDKIAAEQNVEKVLTVTLEIGEVSGVVPEYLVDCWNYFKKKHPILTESVLTWEEIPALTYCEDCGERYDTVPHGKTCPKCGSPNTFLLQGRELNIKEIEAC